MKILGSLFRLLCALLVLLSVAVYLDGPLQSSINDYLRSFTPEHIQSLTDLQGWFTITVGALLLLTICGCMKLGWNMLYSLATLAFFAEVAVMTLTPELALPSALRGLGWEARLSELALSYPVPTLMIPCVCILGCLCSSAPVLIAVTSFASYALFYGCSELLSLGVHQWQAMPEPFAPHVLERITDFPWCVAGFSAILFTQFTLFMAMIETFSPRRKKTSSPELPQEAPQAPAPQKDSKDDGEAEEETEAPRPAAAPVVRVKRPVIHKKGPISAAAAGATPEAEHPLIEAPGESTPEEAQAEPASETETKEPAANEEAKPEPAAEEPKAETAPEGPTAEEPKAETAPEGPTAEEPKAETAPEGPTAEEPKAETAPEGPAAEEPKTEPSLEEPAAVDTKPESSTEKEAAEEPKVESDSEGKPTPLAE